MKYQVLINTFTFFILCLFSGLANAQLLSIQSADSLNGKPKKQFYSTAWIKMNMFYDHKGIPNVSAMHLPSIPTDRENVVDDPQVHADLNQTRLIFASTFQSEYLGEILSYIETDFYGSGGGGLRLRHAYIRFNNWRIGQSWSGFTDEEAWPNITDFDGPSTGAWVRSVQVTYFFRLQPNMDWSVGVELPTADYSRYLAIDTLVTPSKQTFPDLVSHYEVRWPKGHFQIAGVGRAIEYRNASQNTVYKIGGGFSGSGSQILFGRDKIIYQMAYGMGISRYLVSFGGGGWDAVPDGKGNLDLVPIYGGYVGYQLFWGKKKYASRDYNHFSSTFVYGYVNLNNPQYGTLGNPTLLTGSYASANLYWNVVGPLNFAIEGIYGFRTDEFESSGQNIRIQTVAEYNF